MSARQIVLAVLVVAVMISAFGLSVAGATHPVAGAASVAAPAITTHAARATTTPTSNPSGAAIAQRALTTAKLDHIPIEALSLPNLLGKSTLSNGVVQPSYLTSPAPMGIGTYGVMNTTGTAEPYSTTSQGWEGAITINSVNSFLMTNDGAISTNGSQSVFGVQLNAVMTNVTVGTTSNYSFWTQNVLYFNFPSPGSITLLDNLWNFSSPAVALTAGTLYSYNGTPVYPQYYYSYGPTFATSFPLTVQLYLNSSTTNIPSTGFGYSTVKYGYNVIEGGASVGSGVYDTVLFSSSTPIGSVPAAPYLVDGSQLTPTGFIPYDAEIMIGGPGGGTTTSIYGINGSETLQYWDATSSSYAVPASAWNVGSETGETSEGIAETYTTPGTVLLGAGPSIPAPLWGATPGGNIGQATFSGPLSPSNAFVFVSSGSSLDPNAAAWAPTQTASTVSYLLPPGTYTAEAMMSDYTPITTTATVGIGGHSTLPFTMARNFATGVYAPLDAWNNGQLAAISFGGYGTASLPYVIENNPSPGGLNSVFGQFNDYLYPVFPGVLIADTTAHVSMNHPSLLNVTYQTSHWAYLLSEGLPLTNNLQFQIYDSSNVSIWGAQGISGWFFFQDYGPTGFLPLANVVIWGGTHDLVGDSTFVGQGSSLLLAGVDHSAATDNVVWGNTFVNSTVLSPTMYPGDGATNGPPIGIFAFESGDWIYNNWVATSITAYSQNVNLFFGSPQLNAENWNLPQIEPAATSVTIFNGYWLTGSITGLAWQGGNYWADYTPGSNLPYDEFGFIATGGDYLPYPLVAYAVVFAAYGSAFGASWSVTLNGYTQTTTGYFLVFYETPGTYGFDAFGPPGGAHVAPGTGTLIVSDQSLYVVLTLT